MSKRLIWLAPAVLILAWIVFGVARYTHLKGLASTLLSGSHEEQVVAARELIKRDKLYETMQAMPAKARTKAVDALRDIQNDSASLPVVKQCISLLKDSDIKTRTAALLTEAQGDVSSLTFLRESDHSRNTANELEKSKKLVAAYTTTMTNEAAFHAEVIKVVTEIGPQDLEIVRLAMKDPDPNVTLGVQDALVAIGGRAVPGLVDDVENAIDLRPFACAVLSRIKDPAITPVIRLLKSTDQNVRMSAASILGAIASKKATSALIEATKDTQAVRRVAISSLCAICDPASIDILVEAVAKNVDDGEVRARAARAISVIGGSKALTTLAGSLGDLDLKVRTSVITGLQTMGASAVPSISNAMSGGSADVRRAGAEALSRINAPAAATALVSLAKDADPIVRESAADGLSFQAPPRLDALVSMLGDSDGRVSHAASQALSALEAKAVPSLIAALAGGSSDVVKYRASEALSTIGSEATPSLVAMLSKGGDVTKWAAYTLGRSVDPQGRSALKKLSASADPDLAYIAGRGSQGL